MKVCKKCNKELPEELFYPHRKSCRYCLQDERREGLARNPICSKCHKNPHALNTVYCKECVNKIAAARRKKDGRLWYKRLTPEQKEKRRRRNSIWSLIARGKLVPQPCEVCGYLITEAHHYMGYAKENRNDIRWLCKVHHAALERWEKKKLTERLVNARRFNIGSSQSQRASGSSNATANT